MVNTQKSLVFYETGSSIEIKLPMGVYFVELWGASGGYYKLPAGGRGSYVSVFISFLDPQTLFLYVGESGSKNNISDTFNGGGGAFYSSTDSSFLPYACSGGGGSDIRLVEGDWYDFNSLKSRIIVAGGGGGEVNYVKSVDINAASGGYGGSYVGGNGSHSLCHNCAYLSHQDATGGRQESGGTGGGSDEYGFGNDGNFGIGGRGKHLSQSWPFGGGGGGYFGGGSGGLSYDNLGSGAGGSSFVSGCLGCSAITNSSIENHISFDGNVHYSGLSFSKPKLLNGSSDFLSLQESSKQATLETEPLK